MEQEFCIFEQIYVKVGLSVSGLTVPCYNDSGSISFPEIMKSRQSVNETKIPNIKSVFSAVENS